MDPGPGAGRDYVQQFQSLFTGQGVMICPLSIATFVHMSKTSTILKKAKTVTGSTFLSGSVTNFNWFGQDYGAGPERR